jgi:hypothetical protein
MYMGNRTRTSRSVPSNAVQQSCALVLMWRGEETPRGGVATVARCVCVAMGTGQTDSLVPVTALNA